MRKSTLLIVSYIIVFPFAYLLPAIAELAGYTSFPAWSLFARSVAAFVGAGVLTVVLTPLNKRLLEWRKARGRDIEAEERHESAHGMISLNPSEESNDRRP